MSCGNKKNVRSKDSGINGTFYRGLRKGFDKVIEIAKECPESNLSPERLEACVKNVIERCYLIGYDPNNERGFNPRNIKSFALYENEKSGLNILDLGVLVDFRRQGLATAVVNKLTEYAKSQNLKYLSSIVRETNLPAQLLLHKKNGLDWVETRKNYFLDTGEDAYLMRKEI